MGKHWNQFFRQQSNEKTFVWQILPKLPDNCGKYLFQYLLGWYSRRSRISKHQYYTMTFLSYVLSSLVPVLAAIKGILFKQDFFDIGVVIITFLSGFSLVIYNMVRPSENWKRFRGCAESLKAEVCKYLVGLDEYSGKNDTEKEQAFIKKMLEITSAEEDLWLADVKKKEELTNEIIERITKSINSTVTTSDSEPLSSDGTHEGNA